MARKHTGEDVFAREGGSGTIQPLSSVGIQCSFAEKFGLVVKKKDNTFQLGPNLDFVLPTVTYTTESTCGKQHSLSMVRRAFCRT